jgi:hypothetical protein
MLARLLQFDCRVLGRPNTDSPRDRRHSRAGGNPGCAAISVGATFGRDKSRPEVAPMLHLETPCAHTL